MSSKLVHCGRGGGGAVGFIVRDELNKLLDELEPDALRALAYLAQRLLIGQRCYGRLDLATDARDWAKERTAEIGDLLVYSAFEALKRDVSREASVPADVCDGLEGRKAGHTWVSDGPRSYCRACGMPASPRNESGST